SLFTWSRARRSPPAWRKLAVPTSSKVTTPKPPLLGEGEHCLLRMEIPDAPTILLSRQSGCWVLSYSTSSGTASRLKLPLLSPSRVGLEVSSSPSLSLCLSIIQKPETPSS